MKRTRLTVLAGLVWILLGCEGEGLSGEAAESSSVDEISSQGENSSAASSEPFPSDPFPSDPFPLDPLANCAAPEGLALSNIDSVVTWINTMPKPLSLACFVKSLPRPMYHLATLSTFSAQPSIGRSSPRVFFFIGNLALTLVPDEAITTVTDRETGEMSQVWDADGKQLLEMSLEVDTDYTHRQSIKGEIAFPVTEALPANAPYADIFFRGDPTVTNCKFCHADETQVDIIEDTPVYRSQMLRNESNAEVSLSFMLNQYLYCDPEANENATYRCTMLEAIYGQGPLVRRSFAPDIPTIFGN